MVSSSAQADPVPRETHWGRVVVLLIALGVILRLGGYLANRSLWLDEAMLAQNILHGQYARLQSAPIGFTTLEKALTTVLGESEYTFRLVPLLASLLTLCLSYRLARHFLSERGAGLALFFICFSRPLIYYGSELKPYSLDTALAAALLLLGLRYHAGRTPGRLLPLALAGAVLTWFSYPCLFVAAALGLWLFYQELRARRYKWAVALLGVGAGWLLSFAIQYELCIQGRYTLGYMERYWAAALAPWPATLSALKWYYAAFTALFQNPAGLAYPKLAALLFICGGGALFWKDRRWLALLLLPLLVTLGASLCHRYPYADRLMLFVVPLLAIGVAAGAELVWSRGKWGGVLAPLLVAALSFQSVSAAAGNLASPPGKQEVRQVLEQIARRRRPDDKLYVHRDAEAIVHFYLKPLRLEQAPLVWGLHPVPPEDRTLFDYVQHLKQFTRGDRVWLIVAEPVKFQEEVPFLLKVFARRGKLRERIEAANATAYLFEFTN